MPLPAITIAGLPVLAAIPALSGVDIDLGWTDFLSKPVKFEELQAALYRQVLCVKQGESAGI